MTACIVGWSHTPFGGHEAEDVESLIAKAKDAVLLGYDVGGYNAQGFTNSLLLPADNVWRLNLAARVENTCATGSTAVHRGLKPIAGLMRWAALAVRKRATARALALAALAGFVAAAGSVAPAFAQAQDLGNSRRVQSTAEVSSVEVGDIAGHVVGVVEFKGLTFFADGEIATHSNPATFDLTNGSGPHQGYVIHYFDDGSTSIERYRGEARLSADGKRTTVEGTFECVGGTGRFVGLKGQGTYRGERLGALQTGDYVYVDTTGSCKVP